MDRLVPPSWLFPACTSTVCNSPWPRRPRLLRSVLLRNGCPGQGPRMTNSRSCRGFKQLVDGGVMTPVASQPEPDDFVFLRDVAPSIRQDIRYAGTNNLIGWPLAGYVLAWQRTSLRCGATIRRSAKRTFFGSAIPPSTPAIPPAPPLKHYARRKPASTWVPAMTR